MVSEEDKNGKREVPRGLLDIFVEDLTPGAAQGRGIDVNQGALVNGIGEGSAAAFTDVLLFDVTLEVNGDRVKSAADLRAKINAPPLEKEINLVLMRSSKRIETTLPSGQIEVVTSRKKERPLGMKLYLAEEDFRDGDPFAVDECVLVCHEDGAAVPDWVVEELAQRSRINLGIDEAPSKKGGRHSNPSAKQNDSLRRKRICCAVLQLTFLEVEHPDPERRRDAKIRLNRFRQNRCDETGFDGFYVAGDDPTVPDAAKI